MVVFLAAALLLTGAAARAFESAFPQVVCHSHITADGQVQPEPYLVISPPEPWSTVRNLLVAPISGVGVSETFRSAVRARPGMQLGSGLFTPRR